MGKIGFMQYFDNDDDDKKQKRPAKAAASETEDGAWFRKYFTDTYDQFYSQAEATVSTFQEQDKFEKEFYHL